MIDCWVTCCIAGSMSFCSYIACFWYSTWGGTWGRGELGSEVSLGGELGSEVSLGARWAWERGELGRWDWEASKIQSEDSLGARQVLEQVEPGNHAASSLGVRWTRDVLATEILTSHLFIPSPVRVFTSRMFFMLMLAWSSEMRICRWSGLSLQLYSAEGSDESERWK